MSAPAAIKKMSAPVAITKKSVGAKTAATTMKKVPGAKADISVVSPQMEAKVPSKATEFENQVTHTLSKMESERTIFLYFVGYCIEPLYSCREGG